MPEVKGNNRMKNLILALIVMVGIVINVQASEGLSLTKKINCYKAINPSAATVTVYTEGDGPQFTESGLSAKLKLDDPTLDTPYETARLLIETQNYKFETLALDFRSSKKGATQTFGVECDGGQMKVKKTANGDVLTSSERLEGDIKSKNADEGCSLGNANFRKLIFKPVKCTKR